MRRVVLGRVVSRVQHKTVFAAFNCWLGEARWRRKSRKTVGRVLSRWRLKSLSACISAWRDKVQDTHHHVRSAVCRTAAVVTADRDGSAVVSVSARYRVGEIVSSRDATDTDRLRGAYLRVGSGTSSATR